MAPCPHQKVLRDPSPTIPPSIPLPCASSTAPEDFTESDLSPDPMDQFARWFRQVAAGGVLHEPNAMVVSTATPDGRPSSRTVLLKQSNDRGFVFFTNYGSRKGRELAANPYVSLLFPWHPMARQVIVTGTASRVSREETVGYFHTRPHGSQLGAWASDQSTVIGSRAELITGTRSWPRATRRARRCPPRRTGAASGWSRRPSSSGRGTGTGCTTGCGMSGRKVPGRWSGSVPRAEGRWTGPQLGKRPGNAETRRLWVLRPQRSRPDLPASLRVGDCLGLAGIRPCTAKSA
ncbi:Pyridoxine/pyridoxamine 5'-phosphate oxidase [Streptomyces microflavus]